MGYCPTLESVPATAECESRDTGTEALGQNPGQVRCTKPVLMPKAHLLKELPVPVVAGRAPLVRHVVHDDYHAALPARAALVPCRSNDDGSQ